MNGIEVKNVSKCFGQVQALDSVNLHFQPGKIYGLLGRNGAGKSTLLNIITNRIFSDSGEVLLDGEPLRENDNTQSKIYMMSEKNYYPDGFRVRDVFKWTKEFYSGFDYELADELCRQFHLNTNKKVKNLSTGFNTIFKIITALSVNAPYVFLDEPVLGLDANNRDLFYRTLIKNYAKNPRTFIISTHLIEEVAAVIEEVVIIKDGRIIENRSTEKLLATGYTASGTIDAVNKFAIGKKVIGEDILGGWKSVYILGQVDKNDLHENIEIQKLELQKLFIRLTNDEEVRS